MQRLEPLPALVADLKRFDVEFVSLSVDHNRDAAKHSLNARFLREHFIAAGTKQLHAARELPSLRQSDGGTDASIGPRAEPNGQDVHVGRNGVARREDIADEFQGRAGSPAGSRP